VNGSIPAPTAPGADMELDRDKIESEDWVQA
jgi:hypothetical protein